VRADNAPLTRVVSSHSATPRLDAAIAKAEAETSAASRPRPKEFVDQPSGLPQEKSSPPGPAPVAATPKVDPDVKTASVPPQPDQDLEHDPAPLPENPSPERKKPAQEVRSSSRVATKAAAVKLEAAPAESWKEGLEHLRELTRGQKKNDNESDVWSVRARALEALGVEPPTPAQVDLWNALLPILTSAASTDSPDEAVVTADLRRAVDALDDLAPLRISELQACRKVHGFGHFDSIDPASLRPGQTVIVYCEMSGLRYAPVEGGYRSRLESRVEIVSRNEKRSIWSQDLGTAEDICRRRRRDYYVNYRLTLPTEIPSGSYELRLTQTDLNGDRSVSATLPLEFRP
jgi:hypothetical protein